MERRNRPDLSLGCLEQVDRDLLEYIWNFGKIGRPEIEAARLDHGPSIPVLRLSRNSEVSTFLASPRSPWHKPYQMQTGPAGIGGQPLPPYCSRNRRPSCEGVGASSRTLR
jgi:hypothetical protein